MIPPLLPRNALKGRRLGLSASDNVPDMRRLGLDTRHFRLALAEMARLVLLGGGTLAWGGHLEPEGLTPLLVEEVRRYGREVAASALEEVPLLVVLAWSVHRNTPVERLDEINNQLGGLGRLLCLDPAGNEIEEYWAGRGTAPEPVSDPQEVAKGLTAMRNKLVALTAGRLMIGGKRSGYTGALPGLVEEAALTIEARQPLYLAAGFGGAAADIAQAVGLPMDWLPDAPDTERDKALEDGLRRLKAQVRTTPRADTGLDREDEVHLARTHRPSEIATLVSQGLGRLAAVS